ncbi:MAG TPA: aldehyde dehydrogenase family protein, partial [Steroidobacteraceae bacterium]|nr:aldehyde dehydrogenase family protein [Steroidobacteraceae bacterium]
MALASPRTIAVRNPRTGQKDFDLPVATAEEVAGKALRLRENQKAWSALGLPGRTAVMARWLGEVRKRAAAIAEADAEDTGGCHTSYLQGFITMGNIGGWIEDAAGALEKASYRGPSRAIP